MKSTSHKSGAAHVDGAVPDVLILCGGLGTRLRSVVSDKPKVLAEVAGKPFLDFLIEYLRENGFGRIILATGHMSDQLEHHYRDKGVEFSVESSPLGTGGAVKNAEHLINSDNFLVMNGDSWIVGGVDLNALVGLHIAKNAVATMALVKPRTDKDYGAVFLKDAGDVGGDVAGGKIAKFNEKSKEGGEHFMNAGVYAMNKRVFDAMPAGVHSLETDFFPQLVSAGSEFYGFPVEGELVDIGTPERYQAAQGKF